MGLDMYMDKVKRVDNVTARDLVGLNNYFSWCCRGNKYKDSTMEEWVGISLDTVNLDFVEDYFPEYKHRYASWDTKKEYGFKTIFQNVAYWRKANAIHKWFVDNVQNGNDDCGTYEVTKENIESLLDICEIIKDKCKLTKGTVINGYSYNNDAFKPIEEDGYVMTNTDIAKSLLPSQNGFFFGSIEYDQWYMEDIKYTINVLKKILKDTDFEKYMIVYNSSW